MTASDLLTALEPVIRALERLGIRYYLGGSVASSSHGVPRTSIDADVIAELSREHLPAFLERLRGAYYIAEDRVRTAVDARRSFNLIHLATMFKIDLFVAKGRPFDRQALERARPGVLDERPGAPAFQVASAEDTVLAKLEWLRAGGEASDRQWADVVGMLRAGRATLDHDHLERWAPALGVEGLLERARAEAESPS